MPTHPIKLRGPWHLSQPPRTTDDVPLPEIPADARRILLPCPADAGPATARYLRHFNAPSHLDPEERMFVVIACTGRLQGLFIDQTHLSPSPVGDHYEADLTPHLVRRHLLAIDLSAPPDAPATPPELQSVRLEIRS